jgi:ribosomal protein S27AE
VTVSPEVRFRCDRCGEEVTQALHNTPVVQRFAPPEKWLTLQIDNIDLRRHLCPNCALAFDDFIER